jgi:hypothetical protein
MHKLQMGPGDSEPQSTWVPPAPRRPGPPGTPRSGAFVATAYPAYVHSDESLPPIFREGRFYSLWGCFVEDVARG